MNTGMIATRYAKALLESACDAQCEDAMYETAKLILQITKNDHALWLALSQQHISLNDKRKLIMTVANQSEGSFYARFTDVLIANKRESYLIAIIHAYTVKYRRMKNIMAATFTTAFEPSQKQVDDLVCKLEKNLHATIELDVQTNHQLLGGFILDLEHINIDASIKRRLQDFQNQFTQSY